MISRVLPATEAEERQVIGDLLNEIPPEEKLAALTIVGPEDFACPNLRRIFEVIASLHKRGLPTDCISVRAELGAAQNGHGPDLSLVLTDLAEQAALPAAVGHHAILLRDAAHRRRLVEALSVAIGRVQKGEDPQSALTGVDELRAALPALGRSTRLLDGAAWILDSPAIQPAVWGRGSEILWAVGELLLLTGPDGVGKTRLLRQLVFALLGLFPDVLGLPVAPAEAKVLLVAADRPAQARRLYAQAVGEEERHLLCERLLVHQGPLDFDIVTDNTALSRFAASNGASDLVIDNLGALVPRLATDEVGSALAISLTRTVADGVQVCGVFHPRKATSDNKEPKELADVYGSRWLTAAAGSVVSLWGRPGDPIVRLRHLKQPALEVGPFDVTFDPIVGYATVSEGTDLLALLRSSARGLTAKEAAGALYSTANPTGAEAERARRKLDRLVPHLAYRRDGSNRSPATWFATAPQGTQERLE